MAEHDDWTAAEDARLRAALSSLRADVEATPLPDVRFVKARGMARRRRRFLAVGAAAAAAVVVAGTVGYCAARSDDPVLEPVPADRSGTTTAAPSPTTTSSLDQAGALPLLQEWKQALDLKGDARMTTQDPKSSDYRSFECLATVPSGQQLRQEITLDAGGFQGGQTQFAVSAGQDPVTVAEGLTNDISQCQQGPDFHVNRLDETDAGSLYSYTAGDAGSGWFAVVTGASDVTLIQVTDPTPGKSQYSLVQVTALAEIAKERLARYGTTVTPTTSAPSTSGPQAIDEKMVVTGPDPVPSSNLFVAASQWASDALTGGAKTTAGPGALEGSTAIASCETDDQQAGMGGQVGVVSIRTGTGTASYLGRQRVQLDDATDAAVQKAYVTARLTEAKALYAKGCDGPNYTVQSTPGPTDGTFRLDTVFTDGSATLSEWVGVTSQRTPGAVSTVVITAAAETPTRASPSSTACSPWPARSRRRRRRPHGSFDSGPGIPRTARRPPPIRVTAVVNSLRQKLLLQAPCMISRIRSAVADGVLPTLTPAASRASCLAAAVPAEPETMAPAWPMVLPSGAVKPAT